MSSHHSSAELSTVPVAAQTAPTHQRAHANRHTNAHRSFLLPAFSLWWREIVRFYRQPSRWVGVLLSPLVFWLVIGSGLGNSFRAGGTGSSSSGSGYLEYFFPGTLILILLFTSIFCMMSVIEDRREGFLKSVLVSPVPRAGLVLGKVTGGATLALFQGFLFLLLAPTIGISLSISRLIETVGVMFLIAFGLTGLGFCIAWRLDSTHGFHALVNLLLIPMWLLSGALFPVSGAASWVGWLMKINPLSYSVIALRGALYRHAEGLSDAESFPLALGVTFAFSIIVFLAALFMASRKQRENLPG